MRIKQNAIELVKSPRYWLTILGYGLLSYSLYALLWEVPPIYPDSTNMAPARLPYCVLCGAFQVTGLAVGIAWRQKRRPVAFGLITVVLVVSLVWIFTLIQWYMQA